MEAKQAGGQVGGDHLQKVAGHGKDLQLVRSIEHVMRKSCISQLVVMEIHRPKNDEENVLVDRIQELCFSRTNQLSP